MSSIKDLNEKLLWEAKEETKEETKDKDKKNDDDKKEDKKSKSLRSREFRDTLQQYKGRVSGTADVEVSYKELKDKLEKEISGVNWTISNVKKVFGIITKMVGVQPEEDK